MKYFLFIIFSLSATISHSQEIRIATLEEDGQYTVEELRSAELNFLHERSVLNQLPGFPFSAKAHPNFKNFRNVSIADLNNDGDSEIIVCLNETLYALNSDGSIMWEAVLKGTSNFPPAIADIDMDGDLEIAVQTYGVPVTGNVYVFDHEGKVLEGWPLNIDNHFFLNGITLANLNNEGSLEIIACERISGSSGRVHAFDLNAESISSDWPVEIPGTPAFTPSVGDINNDGVNDLITCTTTALYAFDATGAILLGFPLLEEGAKFSYQSPILADLDDDNKKEIITARHNDLPGTTVVKSDGSYFGEWPDYDDIWTFATPAVVDIDQDGDYEVFYSRPHVSDVEVSDVVLGYDHLGNRLEGFQIQDLVGSEGILSIADIDNDGDYEILTASKATIDGKGLIQAYHFENGNAVSNFPLLVEGFTFTNGAYLSDIDNDGMMDLTALSYQLKFDQSSPDSAFINVFNLEIPYDEGSILFNGYKGGNTHDGNIDQLPSSNTNIAERIFTLSPNPAFDKLRIQGNLSNSRFHIYNVGGKLLTEGDVQEGNIDLKSLKAGTYILKINGHVEKFVKI